MKQQAPLFITGDAFDPLAFDKCIVFFSGGKDGLSSLLHLLDIGFPKESIELWHHEVDGREGSDLMDWPCTRDYCIKVAAAFGLPLYFSWRQGGFEREMLRQDALTAPTIVETPDGIVTAGGVRGTPSTRRKFPQLSADLSVRYCSAALKIDVGAIAITNQQRFDGRRTLVVTGERAEESPARAKYKVAEPHRTSNGKREVWQWRPVHSWTEKQVWAIIERYAVNPHPAYHLGWSRVSCMSCIFGSPNQWASINEIAPQKIVKIAAYEKDFGVTIRRDGDIYKAIAKGTPYRMDANHVQAALSHTYEEPIFVEPWVLPAGAFGESAGPPT